MDRRLVRAADRPRILKFRFEAIHSVSHFLERDFKVRGPFTARKSIGAVDDDLGDKIDQFFEILAPTNVRNGCPLNGRN